LKSILVDSFIVLFVSGSLASLHYLSTLCVPAFHGLAYYNNFSSSVSGNLGCFHLGVI
jgi:hypothetical protein